MLPGAPGCRSGRARGVPASQTHGGPNHPPASSCLARAPQGTAAPCSTWLCPSPRVPPRSAQLLGAGKGAGQGGTGGGIFF